MAAPRFSIADCALRTLYFNPDWPNRGGNRTSDRV